MRLLQAIRKHKGRDWSRICDEMGEFSKEEIIFNFLKLPFINISNLQIMKNENNPSAGLGEREPGIGLDRLKEDDGKLKNPLKPHVSPIFGFFDFW